MYLRERALQTRVRRVQEIDRVNGAATCSGAQHSRADLHLAARIAGGDQLGTRCRDVGELGIEYEPRNLRLEQIVDARRAATLVGIRQRNDFELGNRT